MKTSRNGKVGRDQGEGECTVLEDTPDVARAGDGPIVEKSPPAGKNRGLKRAFDLTHYAEVNAAMAAEILAMSSPEQIVAEMDEIQRKACTYDRHGNEYPDWRTRLAVLTLKLHYLLGKPIERQQIVTATVSGENETALIERLAKSPAMREALRGVLGEAEKTVEK